MSEAAWRDDATGRGTGLLPVDLEASQLASAPALPSLEALLIDDLSVEEEDAFFAALGR
ncbi:MAG: hypothetical protein ACT4OS_06800 [Acidimicrobiales bacterium]